MSPVAGKTRPKTRSSGIFSTKRRSAVRVSRLTRILVPNPKKAFQSPGTQSLGLAAAVVVMGLSLVVLSDSSSDAGADSDLRNRGVDAGRVSHPAEDAPLRLDHLQPGS